MNPDIEDVLQCALSAMQDVDYPMSEYVRRRIEEGIAINRYADCSDDELKSLYANFINHEAGRMIRWMLRTRGLTT